MGSECGTGGTNSFCIFFIWLAHGVGTVVTVVASVASVAEWQEEHRPGKEIQWDFQDLSVKDCKDSVDDHLKTGLLC